MFAKLSRTLHSGLWTALLCAALGACATSPHKTEAQRQSDKAVVDRVEAALAADQELYSRHITVRADEGVVRLTGFVWDPPDLVEAERIAGAVPGVTRVVNALELQRNGQGNSPVSR